MVFLLDMEDQEFNIPNIMAAIVSVTNWRYLGKRLGLKPAKIAKIAECDDIDESKNKLICLWIRIDSEASWKKLKEALDRLEFKIFNILTCIVDVSNWEDLGLQLGLKPSQLNSCERKESMIELWMKLDPEASWEKLQEALESPALCENQASKGIADRRGSSFDKRNVLVTQSSVNSGQ